MDFSLSEKNHETNPATPVTDLEFSGQHVRMHVDENGNPWWVARDVCACLGIKNPNDALAKSLDVDEKGIASIYTHGGPQRVAIINEPGLYALIMRSRKAEAKKFKRWILHDVLPSIRKHGMYVRPGQDPVVAMFEAMRDRRLAELELARRQAVLEQRIDEAERTADAALATSQGNLGYYSVLGWARLCGFELDLNAASRIGKALSRICRAEGLNVGYVRDPRFGRVQTYPESILRNYSFDTLEGENHENRGMAN